MSAKGILISAYGTRGDVEPFLALAKGLQSAGFDVVLATSSRWRRPSEQRCRTRICAKTPEIRPRVSVRRMASKPQWTSL
ncbi:glycosyltransferase [Martelella soudanensis]|uniref:glycosyltransferase n=1 Tax=unclassified Martelella TaxID=2629616 RepID=UPI0015DE8943